MSIKQNRSGLFRRWRQLAALLSLAALLINCGGASGAPTVSIPAPVVTKITISTPDSGVSTITGDAGAVVGGNTVRAINLTQEGIAFWWEPLVWGTAYAQTTNETVAAADGSFTLQIDAAVGDRIRILQIDPVTGDTSPPIELTVPFQVLPLAFVPVDIAPDTTTSQAWMAGQFLGNGILNPVIFGANPATGAGINLPAGCNDPTALAIDEANARAIVVDNSTGGVCSQPLDGSAGATLAFLTVNPVNVAIHAGAAKAVIVNDTAIVNPVEVSILDLNTDAFAPAPLTNPVGGLDQTRTPVVMTATNGATNYAVVVVEYSNGEFYASVVDVDGPAEIGSPTLLNITSAQDIAGFNNTNAVLVDGAGVAHILDINTTTGTVTISNSVTVGNNPSGVAIDAGNNRAFVTNRDDDTLSVIDLTSGSEAVTNTLNLPDDPTGIGFDGSGQNQLAVIHAAAQVAAVLSSAL